jgi:predicted Zn-dependent protease
MQSRDSERAVLALERFLKSNPEDLDAIGVLGTALVNLDRVDQVTQLIEPLIESGKATIDMRLVLARIYNSKSDPKKVVDILSSVAALWPEDVRISNLLSQAHQALGNTAESDRFAKVAEAGQADVQSIDGRLARLLSGTDRQAQQHYELGHILLHKQSREDGLYWLNLALSIDETFLPAHEDMVIYFNRTNKPELAARHQRYINLRRGVQ